MEDQHKKIKGYRELTQEEIDLMNRIKEQGECLDMLLSELDKSKGIDPIWLTEAEMQLKKGIMAAVRAVAKPNSF